MSHHRPTTKPERIVIIGAGMAGLASAARLAKRGHHVTIVEANSRVGGKCFTDEIDGYHFDVGPSLLTLPAVYRDLYIKTGKRLEHSVTITPVDPAFTYIFHDGTKVTFPNLSHAGTVEAIRKSLGDEAANAWHELLSRAEAMWESSRTDFVESELRSIYAFLKRRTFLPDLWTIAPWKSLRKITSEYTTNPYIAKIIDRYATYTGSDPRRAPAVLLTIAFVEEAFGAWHIGGGLGNLATSLEDRVVELGVELRLDTRVASINLSNGRAVGVTLENGERIDADIVISNVDSYNLYEKLLPRIRRTRSTRRALSRATPSLSGFTIELGLDGKSDLGHHTVLFPEDYDAEFNSIFEFNEPVLEPAIYICNPRDKEMTPNSESESWTILINAPRHDPVHGFDWRSPGFPEKYAERIIDQIEARGITVRDRIRVMKIRTPADLEFDVSAPGGSIYGTSSNGARSAFLRAKNRSPITNLYCVGGSAHPGGGLPLVAISAELVSEAIAEREEG